MLLFPLSCLYTLNPCIRPLRRNISSIAMVLMILWQAADSRGSSAKDKWWLDMRIETQLLCEQAIRRFSRGDSKIYFHYEDQVMCCIDIVKMTAKPSVRNSPSVAKIGGDKLLHYGRFFQSYTTPNPSNTQQLGIYRDWKEEQRWKAALEPPRKSSHRFRS